MAVASNGDFAGSIGGGIMEFNIIKNCRQLLKKDIKVNKLETLYHNRKSSSVQQIRSDMRRLAN